jgi:hypothetical protein
MKPAYFEASCKTNDGTTITRGGKRAGAGRPKTSSKKTITLRLTQKTLTELSSMAKFTGVSRSAMVEAVLNAASTDRNQARAERDAAKAERDVLVKKCGDLTLACWKYRNEITTLEKGLVERIITTPEMHAIFGAQDKLIEELLNDIARWEKISKSLGGSWRYVLGNSDVLQAGDWAIDASGKKSHDVSPCSYGCLVQNYFGSSQVGWTVTRAAPVLSDRLLKGGDSAPAVPALAPAPDPTV